MWLLLTLFQAGRGGFDAPKICKSLQQLGINLLFVIGGDGTQFAGSPLPDADRRRGEGGLAHPAAPRGRPLALRGGEAAEAAHLDCRRAKVDRQRRPVCRPHLWLRLGTSLPCRPRAAAGRSDRCFVFARRRWSRRRR